MEILFENLQKKIALNPPRILKLVKTILRHEGIHKASLSVVFVSHQRIKALNKKYLGREYATDVLAFDLTECTKTAGPISTSGKNRRIMGDIVISTDTAIKNSKIYKTKLSEELALYMIHGILHILGFDDHKNRDVVKMRAKERELLEYLGANIKNIIKRK